MNSDNALQLFNGLLINTILISGPMLVLALLVGLLVSIIQVVTQIQDTSLTFIPKLIALVLAAAMFGPWMLRKLILYATSLISNIPSYF